MKQEKVWLVTGSSRGIGRAITEEALKRGYRVGATARDTKDLKDLAEQYPEHCLPIQLDVNKHEQGEAARQQLLDRWGRIDVLVNNAGYGLQGMVEEADMKDVHHQMETNFFGLLALTQAVLPTMREQKSGYIVNFSSIAGLRGSPGLGIYNASKFAVEGLSEALAEEVQQFGIKVSIVEPGPYRTDWAGSSLQRNEAMKDLDEDSPYFGLNKRIKEFFDDRAGNQPGDPRQIAQVLCDAAEAEKPPLHMVFGDIAIQLWQERVEQLNQADFLSVYPHEQTSL